MRNKRTFKQPAPAPREAVVYARISDAKKQSGNFSLDAQQEAAQKYALAHGFTIVRTFIEEDSAKAPGRKKFGDLARFVREHPRPLVGLFHKTDRSTRNFHDWAMLDDLIRDHDFSLHFIDHGMVFDRDSAPATVLALEIEVCFSRNFIRNLSTEVRKGMGEKARQGWKPGKAPLGYLNNQTTRLIDLDPRRAPIIRRMFELYATGAYSLDDLHRFAHEQGLSDSPFARGSVSRSTIERILKDPFYAGVLRHKGEVLVGAHEPLITRQLFEKVQAVREGRAGGLQQQKRTFAFTGLLTCQFCGCKITAEIKKGRYVYYHCTGKRGPCPGKAHSWREEALSEQFAHAVRTLGLDDRVSATHYATQHLEQFQQASAVAARRASLKAEEARVRGFLKRNELRFTMEEIGAETYRSQKEHFESELDRIQRVHHELSTGQGGCVVQQGLADLLRSSGRLFVRQDAHEQRRLLQHLVEGFLLGENGVVTIYRKPFDRLLGSDTT